jgi:heme A synthase
MTVWQYTAGPVRIRRWSKLAALLMAVQALASFAAAILHGDANLPSEAVNAAICLFASLGMYWIHRTEAGIVYEQSPSGNEAPRDGYYIDA